jgi:hypothetical protein
VATFEGRARIFESRVVGEWRRRRGRKGRESS